MAPQCPTVFIVDGDAASRESVHALVATMGVATAAFASAERFLDHYNDETPGCLVTELRMMGMSGTELQESLTNRQTPLPMIVLTAFADVPSTVEVMQLGAFTLLEKPCRDSQLWDAIRKALALDKKRWALRQRKQELLSRIEMFTERERHIVDMIVQGVPNKAIAARLQLSLRTIEMRRRDIYRKMKTDSIAELVSLVKEAEQPICYCHVGQSG